jgi:hypothetical protein
LGSICRGGECYSRKMDRRHPPRPPCLLRRDCQAGSNLRTTHSLIGTPRLSVTPHHCRNRRWHSAGAGSTTSVGSFVNYQLSERETHRCPSAILALPDPCSRGTHGARVSSIERSNSDLGRLHPGSRRAIAPQEYSPAASGSDGHRPRQRLALFMGGTGAKDWAPFVRRARLRAFLKPVFGNSRTSLPSPKSEIGKKRAETGARNPHPKD